MTEIDQVVWVSAASMETECYISKLEVMCSDQPGAPLTKEQFRYLLDLSEISRLGGAVGADKIPRKFCGERPSTKIKKLPYFFFCKSFFVMSEACADIFRRFNLGDGGLYPIEIYQGDRKTLVTESGPYFILDFGATKRALLPKETNLENLSEIGRQDDMIWLMSTGVLDDEIALDETALSGPDLWIDPRICKAFFLSAPLRDALHAAKFDKRLYLKSCRIIAP